MNTFILNRSSGLFCGEYQSLTSKPVSGSSELNLTKFKVSCAACHRIGLTVLPVCGPGSRSDAFLAKPSTVHSVASVLSIGSGAAAAVSVLVPPCGALAALDGETAESVRKLMPHPRRVNERLAANAADRR